MILRTRMGVVEEWKIMKPRKRNMCGLGVEVKRRKEEAGGRRK